MSVEGLQFEDSLFYDESKLRAIGEAKCIENPTRSKKWNVTELFYKGGDKGPILQLRERDRNKVHLVLFSTIDVPDEYLGETRLTFEQLGDHKSRRIFERSNAILKPKKKFQSIESMLNFASRVELVFIEFDDIENKNREYLESVHNTSVTASLLDLQDALSGHLTHLMALAAEEQ